MGVAFHGMDVEQRKEMTVETFASTLNNLSLQRHFLAVETSTLEAAVRAGAEYLQIRPSPSGPAIRVVEEEAGETDRVCPVTCETLMSCMIGVLQRLMGQLERMTTRTESARPKREQAKTGKKCWGCHKKGHWRKDCPTWPWRQRPSRETSWARSSRISYCLQKGLLED